MITVVSELPPSSTSSQDGTSYTRTWQVISDDGSDGCDAVRNAVGIGLRDQHPDNVESLAQSDSVDAGERLEDGGIVWSYRVDYSRPEFAAAPWLDPVKSDWAFVQRQRPIAFDAQNNPICNSAGDPWHDPVIIDDADLVLTVSRNEQSFNHALVYSYRRAVNADTFAGAAPETVRLVGASARRQSDDTWGPYYACQYQFAYNIDGWQLRLLDAGYRELERQLRDDETRLDAIDRRKRNILVDGAPAQEVVLLDGRGQQLANADPVDLGGGKTAPKPPQYLDIPIYRKLPFAALGLGL